MAKSVKITGKIEFPHEDGQTTAPIDLGLTFIYTQKVSLDLNYDNAVTDSAVNLGTLAAGGAKFLLVKSPTGGCSIKLNSSSVSTAVAAGTGYTLIVNPSAGTITALSVTTTGAATVELVALA